MAGVYKQTTRSDTQHAVPVMASLADLYIQVIMPGMHHAVSSVSALGTIIVMPAMQHVISSASAVGTITVIP